MPKRKKKPHDFSVIAHHVVQEATHEGGDTELEQSTSKKLDYADLGRRGGKKGGPARAKKLSADQRKEIARKAAEARWNR